MKDRSNVRQAFIIGQTHIEPGMILEISYRKKDKNGDRLPPKTYYVISLSPGTLHNNNLHVIDLQESSNMQMINSANYFNLIPVRNAKYKQTLKYRVEKFGQFDGSKKFYTTNKKVLTEAKTFGFAYKIFNSEGIVSFRLLDYNWPQALVFSQRRLLKEKTGNIG